jgi:hypothetical protein
MTHRRRSSWGSVALVLLFAVTAQSQEYQAPRWQSSPYSNVSPNNRVSSKLVGFQESGQPVQAGQNITLPGQSAATSEPTFQPDLTAAQGNQTTQPAPAFSQSPGLTSSIEDPVVNLRETRLLREQAKMPGDALFSRSPLTPIRENFIAREKRIYEATDIKFGSNLNTLFQGLTDNIEGTDGYGMASFLQLNGTWDGFRKGQRNQGEITLGIEGRWNWGTTDPTTLGAVGLGSQTFTSNPFTTYTPTFLVRNLFWRQGSREAGWMYRIGRVTPDQFLSTSQHVTPLLHNLPIAGTGAFAMGLPDSGIGAFGGFFINDRVNIAGVVTDANADRTKFGQIQEGDLFTAL